MPASPVAGGGAAGGRRDECGQRVEVAGGENVEDLADVDVQPQPLLDRRMEHDHRQ
ncbi:hypothetical protein [Streptomyces synnematoformans]|uniref:hypothetical protein n=1 Tax=Streptomyces synnematoformans TaxID=415721 RepID=UPI0031DD950A